MIEPAPPTSVEVAIAASARRARVLAGVQSIALIAIVAVGSRAACGQEPAPARGDAGTDADAGEPYDAMHATTDAGAEPDAGGLACANAAECRAACEDSSGRRAVVCVRWADMMRTGAGGARADLPGARDQYRTACRETNDALACTRLALTAGLLHDLDLAPEWLEPERAPLGLLAAACTADRERGRLACAALELLVPASPLARGPRGELCRGDEAARAACAAEIALSACRGGDAETCYLATRARPPARDEAAEQLRKLCEEKADRPACLYRFKLAEPSPLAQDSLLAACSSRPEERREAIASACLAHAVLEPRRPTLAERACELGSCQDPQLRALSAQTLKRACDAGHVNGCANLIFAVRGNPASWKAIADSVARRFPAFAARASTAQQADVVACQLGSLDGCNTAVKRIGSADRPRAAQLQDFSARLVSPLTTP